LLALTKKHTEHFDAWHDEQVAVSEFAVQWTDEVGAFWGMNVGTAEIECQMLPETASDPERDTPILCSSFAGGWFPHDEAIALSYQHPNCPHHPAKSRVKEGTLPLFMGIGFSRYNTENLPDC